MPLGKVLRKIKRLIGASESIDVADADHELVERVRKHVALDDENTQEQRRLELDDLRYCDPETQWTEDERRSREDAGRPCLTEDRLGPFLLQVCNEQRKNKPGVQVNPVDNESDVDTAEVIQGLIRHIEYDSNADTAYDTAFWWAVNCGRGFYRICTDYVSSDSFDQEIKIKRIANPHSVFIDPAAIECDYSDAQWGGFKVWMSQEDFKANYPDSALARVGNEAWKSIGDDAPDWMAKDGGACMVVEYFYKEHKKTRIYLGDDGKTTEKIPGDADQSRVRDTIKTQVKWVKNTAVEILERKDFPSQYIPIIPVLGKELIVNGKRTYAGLIRAGKDPQKRHNYLLTAQIERIAFMPLSTWVGAKGFMGKNAKAWNSSHKTQMAALEFEIIGDEGQAINRPELMSAEAPIRAITEAMMGAEQGMKAVLGMYDPNMGKNESNQSGIAINRLQAQGETGNFHFQDNLSRALRYEGRIICDLLRTVYDTERVLRVIGEDGTQKKVRVNAEPGDDDDGNMVEGVKRAFDITTGKYDVTISAGPSYQSKRQEDRAVVMGMLQGPMGESLAQIGPDLIVSMLDTPIAKELAKRYKKMLPAPLQDDQQGQQIPPQIQQQLQQEGQMVQALTKAVHDLKDQLEDKDQALHAEFQKAQLQADTSITVAKINAASAIAQTEMKLGLPGAEQKADALAANVSQLEELVLSLVDHVAGPVVPPETSQEGAPLPMGAPPNAAEPALQTSPGTPSGEQPQEPPADAGMEPQ